jgi:hypothetical protein
VLSGDPALLEALVQRHWRRAARSIDLLNDRASNEFDSFDAEPGSSLFEDGPWSMSAGLGTVGQRSPAVTNPDSIMRIAERTNGISRALTTKPARS